MGKSAGAGRNRWKRTLLLGQIQFSEVKEEQIVETGRHFQRQGLVPEHWALLGWRTATSQLLLSRGTGREKTADQSQSGNRSPQVVGLSSGKSLAILLQTLKVTVSDTATSHKLCLVTWHQGKQTSPTVAGRARACGQGRERGKVRGVRARRTCSLHHVTPSPCRHLLSMLSKAEPGNLLPCDWHWLLRKLHRSRLLG